MAKRKTAGSTKSKSPQTGQIAVSFQPEYDQDFPTVYSNFASITHTNNEFCLDFCLLAPPYRVDVDNKVVAANVIARVMIPPKLVEGLREALRIELEKHSKDQPDTLMIPVRRSPE